MIRPIAPLRSAAFAALAGTLIAAVCFAGVAPRPAHASTVRWVAASGTAGAGTSCEQPNYVGATHLSIQAAIDASSAGDEVMICSGEYAVGATITVNKNLTLTGSGSTLPILDGGNSTRIMSIGTSESQVAAMVRKLWIRDGQIVGDGNFGAGISVHRDSDLIVEDSHFTNNRGESDGKGGGIALMGPSDASSSGSLQVRRSTFKDNYGYDGGGVLVGGLGVVALIENSTFVGNTAARSAGAIGGSTADVTASNSTFIDNTTVDTFGGETVWWVKMIANLVVYTKPGTPRSDACGYRNGESTNLGFRNSNLIDNVSTHESCVRIDDPSTDGLNEAEQTSSYASLDLGFLAPWVTNVPTMSIGQSSAAIDAVDQSNCPATDQRGEDRSGTTCDAGAFEYQSSPASVTATPSTVALFKGLPVAATFAAAGITPQTFRVASEVSESLPSGVTMNSTTGEITGTPGDSYLSDSLVVTAVDANGVTASARLLIDNCVSGQDEAGKYVVASVEDLEVFRLGACGSDADFVQSRDLNWTGSWESQATASAPFTGSYDGGGHSITGLQATGITASFVGVSNGASFRDLSLDVDFDGSYDYYRYAPGGVVGIAFNTTIDGVHLTGTVGSNTATSDIGECIGGLVGEGDGITVRNSSFEGTVGDALSPYVGGLIGCPYAVSVIEDSSFDGVITGTYDVGGLAGWVDGTTIRRSFATGTVTATGDDAGGLVGYDAGGMVLENSYFVGSVGGAGKVGGLVGYSINSSVGNSYASATITGTSAVGGLVGELENTTITSSFWEAGLAGADGLYPIGNIVGGGQQPEITATPGESMKTHAFFDTAEWVIRDGWIAPADSQHTWGICSGVTRPFLSWQYTTDRCAPPTDDSSDPDDGDSGSTPGNDSNNPPSNESGTPTNNESPAAPTSGTPTSAASAGDTNSSTATPAAPASVVEQTSKSSTSVDAGPKVAAGKFATMVGDKPVKSTVKWRSGSTIKGMVGVVNVAVVMNPGSVTYNMPGTLQPGSSFALTLRGLKPGSDVIVNIHSTTRRLGRFTASSAGAIDTEVEIPMDMAAGSHRVEVQAVDKNGEKVSMWMGVKVQSVETLPSTGTSSSAPAMFALLLLCVGSLFVSARRSKVV